MLTNERLKEISQTAIAIGVEESREMARELLAIRAAFGADLFTEGRV